MFSELNFHQSQDSVVMYNNEKIENYGELCCSPIENHTHTTTHPLLPLDVSFLSSTEKLIQTSVIIHTLVFIDSELEPESLFESFRQIDLEIG